MPPPSSQCPSCSLFDKGLQLLRPEIVPFRLTANMLDGMGLSGYEGCFRRVAEVTMTVLRGNRDMLLSVLESFIHDPLVEWTTSSDSAARSAAARGGARAGAAGAAGSDKTAARSVPSTLQGAEKENKDGLLMVKHIAERLDGFYNVGIEYVDPQWIEQCNRSIQNLENNSAAEKKREPVIKIGYHSSRLHTAGGSGGGASRKFGASALSGTLRHGRGFYTLRARIRLVFLYHLVPPLPPPPCNVQSKVRSTASSARPFRTRTSPSCTSAGWRSYKTEVT